MPQPKDIWYYCGDCRTYFQELERIKECRSFGHKIRRRTPIRLRLVHGVPQGEDYKFKLDVDGITWICWANGSTKIGSYFVLAPPISNIAKKLSFMNPNGEVTTEQLEKMLVKAVQQSVYADVGNRRGKFLLVLENGKWVCSTLSRESTKRRSEEEIRAEALKNMQLMR